MDNGVKVNAAMKRFVRELLGTNENSKQVFIVSGAPGSGKSTYTRQNKRPGDIVIDLDLLAAALQGETTPHPDYDPVMDAVLAAREAVYQTIEERNGKWNRAFVITSSPDPKTVKDIADRLDGEIIKMQATKEQCIQHIRSDSTRTDIERDIRLAEDWFSGE